MAPVVLILAINCLNFQYVAINAFHSLKTLQKMRKNKSNELEINGNWFNVYS